MGVRNASLSAGFFAFFAFFARDFSTTIDMTDTFSAEPIHHDREATHHEAIDPRQASPFARFFFLRSTFAILLCVLMVVGGLIGAIGMVKEGDPEISQAIANVETIWAGADPETVENQVTDKIEKELKSVKGLKNLSSASFEGRSLIKVEFTVDAPVSDSINLVRAEVDEAKPEIAADAEEPKVEQISTTDVPILTVGIYGDIDPAILSRAAEDIEDRLEKVPNVRKVDLSGKREEVIHVQMIPSHLIALGISPTTVSQAIQTGNRDMPWDRLESDAIGSQVRLYGRFRTLDELRDLPVARLGSSPGSTDGRVVRLGEVATVRRDLERETNRAFLSADNEAFQPSINIDIVKVPGADTIKIVDACLAELDLLRQDPNVWPYNMKYRVISTDATTIQNDLAELGNNVLQGILGVFLVLLVALTWREATIAGLSIPLTFLGAIAILFLAGQTLNTMVQVGMILSLGLLVDVFILMMEGMHEGMFVEGLAFNQAALKTVRTYAAPAFAGQLTTILALAPLMSIGGTMGRFVRLIPISAIVCLLLSYAIALLVDIPISRFLLANVKGGNKKTFVDKLTERASHQFSRWCYYNTVVTRTASRLWTLAAIGIFVFSLVLASSLPSSLFPEDDNTKLSINIELPPSTTLDTSQEVADLVGSQLREAGYFESIVKLVGQRSNLVQESGLKPNSGSYLVGFSAIFTPEDRREKLSYEYADELRQSLAKTLRAYPGTTLVVNAQTTGGEGDPIEVEISGNNMKVLRRLSSEAQLALRKIPGAVDVRDDLGPERRDLKLIPRREAMNFYGLQADDLALQGRYIMTDNDIGDYPIGGGEEDLEIRLSMAWPSRNGAIGGPTRADELETIRVISPNGETLTGSQLLEEREGVAPLAITHQDGQRTVALLAKNRGRTVGEILGDFIPQLDEMKRSWPAGYQYKIAGEAETQGETFGSAGIMAIVALFLVFAVLVIQFGSFTQPVIIMLAIPFALIGTFTGFFLLTVPISFPAVIGIIALTGIVVNDAIVMVETMNGHRDNGLAIREAAARGAADRLRPILTTSITTIVGVIPLALSDPIWFPLASAIGFGLVAATGVALLVIPCLYLLLTPERVSTLEEIEAG